MKRKIKIFIFQGTAGERMLKQLKKEYIEEFVCSDIQTMQDAVSLAFGASKKGDVIILSPGAASFNMFLNEFDRGKKFNQAVKRIAKTAKIC